MNIIITGGAGFIGTFTIEELLKEKEHKVTIIDNLSTGLESNLSKDINFLRGDICDSLFMKTVDIEKADIVMHLAAQTSVPHSINYPAYDSKVNILGLINTLDMAKRLKIKKVIFASSAAVYGKNEDVPINENVQLDPLSPYGISKKTGEEYIEWYCNHHGIDYVIFRYANVYGPKQTEKGEGGVLKIFVDNMLNGKENYIFGDGNQTRDFIYVEDIAKANVKAVELPTGIYNVGSGKEVKINDLFKIVQKYCQTENEPVYKEEREGDIYRSCLNNKKITQAGWYSDFSLEEGIQKTIEAMSEQK